MAVAKPPSIERDPFRSAKWDELASVRAFEAADAPALALLCQWHAVVQRCIDDMDELDGQVAYQNDAGDLKTLPQIAAMKQASAEIRALNKQLGIGEEAKNSESKKSEAARVLTMVIGDRQRKAAGA